MSGSPRVGLTTHTGLVAGGGFRTVHALFRAGERFFAEFILSAVEACPKSDRTELRMPETGADGYLGRPNGESLQLLHHLLDLAPLNNWSEEAFFD